MRVILVHNNYDVIGGAEVFYHEVGRVLEKNGHQVAYFSAAGGDAESEWSKYFPEAKDYSTGSTLTKVIAFPSMVHSTPAKLAMAKLIADFKPDIIHAFAVYVKLTPSVLEAGREAGIPVVMSCNDYKHICPNYKLFHGGKICEECKNQNFLRAVANRCCHDSLAYSTASMLEAFVHHKKNVYRENVNLFLFASKFMAHKTEEFWGEGSFKWNLLKNPFNVDKFLLDGDVGEDILYFGRLVEEKGVGVLVLAAKQSPNVTINIIGEGPEEPKLRHLVDELGLSNIHFIGPKWGDELESYIKSCRAVVVPSTWHENFPYVVFQAFAAGKCVIGTNRGGIPELVSDGERGWIYEATDHEALSKTIEQVVAMPDHDLASMGAVAKKYVSDEFGDEQFYRNLTRAYAQVVS